MHECICLLPSPAWLGLSSGLDRSPSRYPANEGIAMEVGLHRSMSVGLVSQWVASRAGKADRLPIHPAHGEGPFASHSHPGDMRGQKGV